MGDEAVLVSYRHVFDDGSRDSVVLRSTDDGQTWPELARLPIDPWYIGGCPLKPTDMAVNENYVYSVSFSAGPEQQGVWFTRSRNGALAFEEAIHMHPASKYSGRAGHHRDAQRGSAGRLAFAQGAQEPVPAVYVGVVRSRRNLYGPVGIAHA